MPAGTSTEQTGINACAGSAAAHSLLPGERGRIGFYSGSGTRRTAVARDWVNTIPISGDEVSWQTLSHRHLGHHSPKRIRFSLVEYIPSLPIGRGQRAC
jgi:hypothetical protein